MRPTAPNLPPRASCIGCTKLLHWIETTGLRKHACKHGRDMHSDIVCRDHKDDRREVPR